MNIRIDKFRLIEKGNLIAFIDATFMDIGMTVHGIKLMNSKKGEAFYSFPSEKFVGKDGKDSYKNHVSFSEKDRYYAFQKSMSDALTKYEEDSKMKKAEEAQTFLSGSSSNDNELPF